MTGNVGSSSDFASLTVTMLAIFNLESSYVNISRILACFLLSVVFLNDSFNYMYFYFHPDVEITVFNVADCLAQSDLT